MVHTKCNHAVVASTLWQSVVTLCLLLYGMGLEENTGHNELKTEHLDVQPKSLAATHYAARAA